MVDFPFPISYQNVIKPQAKLIKTNLTVDIGRGVVSHPEENCNKIKRSQTWNARIPTGYINGSHWVSLICNNTLNIASLRSCLNNTNLIMSGDSTTRQYYQYLTSKIVPDCKQITKKWTTPKWHEPAKCESKTRNLTILWNPHELPFVNAKREGQITNLKSTVEIVNGIKSGENVVFVIHYYCHLIRNHYTIFINQLRILKESVKKVLLRNKQVKILIKSPYAFDVQDCKTQISDLHAKIYVEIIKRELREFQDSIVYMNIWEMSVAMEQIGIHPKENVLWEHIQMMFGYICK
ncbi:hypothetical protein LOTGIDRAFT_164299 [Lottia gigantea]|uniref:NXPE C-terminal domain-containing protein n=1 Tax=Lottia gigantea TaxID=225164 RepID=V4A154_LOTGI|nr:hypothetical protein LOTGIDRAFT_164299 [Lottia gigantea]ESO90372.1 hypothetical protein LOTGIDRAFT_164299 [Lottia gigantea]